MKALDGRAERGEADPAAHISNPQEALPAQFSVFEGGAAVLAPPLPPTHIHTPISVCLCTSRGRNTLTCESVA